jgi:hypothetical protein
MGAPVEMTVSRKDSDGLNNVRSNLVVATRSVSAARAVNVLKRGNFKPAGEPIESCARSSRTERPEFTSMIGERGVFCARGMRTL